MQKVTKQNDDVFKIALRGNFVCFVFFVVNGPLDLFQLSLQAFADIPV